MNRDKKNMACEAFHVYYFKTECKCRTVFMKSKDGQTVGDAIYGVIGEWNVVGDEILAKTNESDLGTYTTSDTPSSILRSFGTKFLTVTIRCKGQIAIHIMFMTI